MLLKQKQLSFINCIRNPYISDTMKNPLQNAIPPSLKSYPAAGQRIGIQIAIQFGFNNFYHLKQAAS
jgi:hypothetical protein